MEVESVILMWYLQRDVILTKDNLEKETRIEADYIVSVIVMKLLHMFFFDCHHTRVAQVTTGLNASRPVSHMIGGWLIKGERRRTYRVLKRVR